MSNVILEYRRVGGVQ